METLNDKIVDILSRCSEWEYLYEETLAETTKEIEKLILQEKIDLLKMLHKPEYTTFILKGTKEELTPEHLLDGYELIEELTQQLKQLKK